MIAFTEFEALEDPKITRFNDQFPRLFYHDLRPKETRCYTDDGRTHFTHCQTGETFTWNALKNTWETTRYKWSGCGWNGESAA